MNEQQTIAGALFHQDSLRIEVSADPDNVSVYVDEPTGLGGPRAAYVTVGVDKLLEAIYTDFPDRRPADGSDQDLEGRLEAEWQNAERGAFSEGDLIIHKPARTAIAAEPRYTVERAIYDDLDGHDSVRIVKRAKPPKPDWYDAKVISGLDGFTRRLFIRSIGGTHWITDAAIEWEPRDVEKLIKDIEIVVGPDA